MRMLKTLFSWQWEILFVLILIFLYGCSEENHKKNNVLIDYKQEMRDFVKGISQYGKSKNPDFIVIPQNGNELVTLTGDCEGRADTSYLNAIDGVGREDLFYGYYTDNELTPIDETEYLVFFLDICEEKGVEVLTADYCWDIDKIDDSYRKNELKNYISFAAPDRELKVIPEYPSILYNENDLDINSLSEAKNFLLLLNPENFSNKNEFIRALKETNYDVIIMDMFFDDLEFTADEINQLKRKKNGGKRLVISYLSIGEAEKYRYYWNSSWQIGNPSWLDGENPEWNENFKVKYWNNDWQKIIYGEDDSYLMKIIHAGFDGVYLDIIDAFEYFENGSFSDEMNHNVVLND